MLLGNKKCRIYAVLDVYKRQLEYGSPKKPALAEAMALNCADNADAKMQTLTEIFKAKDTKDWLGYNRLFESNLRKTSI